MKRPLAALARAAVLAAALATAGCGTPQPHSESATWLGTLCTVTVYGPPPRGLFAKVFARLADIDTHMGLDRKGSELDRINAAAGREPVVVSPETFDVIKTALEYAKLTDGAFDITVEPLVKLWDIGGGTGRVPSTAEITRTLPLVDYRRVSLDEAASSVSLPEAGMGIDLGGIAKGYAADQLARIVTAAGVKRAIIDLGGNIMVIGSRPTGGPWRVGIQDPDRQRGEYLGIVDVSDATVVTSGVYERYFIKDGIRYHHILDPKTGSPARTGLLSVSIVAKNSMDADALATGVFVLGVKRGLALVEELPDVEAIFVTEDHRVITSPGLAGTFRVTSSVYKAVAP